jgi:hypothetical protein
MAKAFLEATQHAFLVSRLDIDDPVGPEACLRDGGCEEVGTRQAPECLAFKTGRDASHEQGGGRTIKRSIAAASHFVQCAEGQPAAGKARVDLPQTEGKGGAGCSSLTFDALDPGA